ncbi:putative phage-associated protein [Actinoplanes campanulatus]|uniref:Putative phage-associated protein n=1 Tax=Actinoplanes campanulatus TaxID=113559 RepID=A0A7W5FIX4_9ACTN|nr:type II toxin-antitoxin system antitoxin SocA domain-containing protein [Actinoplanes campanulatus]MBB3100002.1 putative phage-associated protein [Actinoplanes campanulatus]GGN29502.1 hypothetical protein GCM10010109_48550 [Actinoplanes campanulatus]GID38869.1 hypothetical protein Aca09nite_53750 [Actinoplanes campanulatus]
MATVHDVASAIVQRLGGMTAMKLEKLVYYCQGWHLARHHRTLFGEPIEAWRQGPVVRDLYDHHRRRYTISSWPWGDDDALTPAERATVQWVTTEYGRFSAVELSRMTHHELPWKAARGALPDHAPSSEHLSIELMKSYFGRQIADTETAVALATANAALEGMEFDADWQDHLREVASGTMTADELIAAEIARFRE